jgi:hypothetical protein
MLELHIRSFQAKSSRSIEPIDGHVARGPGRNVTAKWDQNLRACCGWFERVMGDTESGGMGGILATRVW